MTTAELATKIELLNSSITAALQNLENQTRSWVDAEREYRKARSKAFLEADGKTVKEREFQTEAQTADLWWNAHLQEGLKETSLELLRSLRAELSAITALAYVHRSEMELARG